MKHIAVFDDHPIVKLSIEAMLNEIKEKFIFYEISGSKDLIRLVNKKELDLLIYDINYPGVDTIKLFNDCLMVYPNLKVLVFSSNLDEIYGKRFMKLGAKGYLNKSATKDEFLNAIQTILSSRKYMSQKLLEQLTDQAIFNKPDDVFSVLSAREFEICMDMVKGLSTSEMANKMGVKPPTIATHKHRIFDKLGIKTIVELFELYKINQPNT